MMTSQKNIDSLEEIRMRQAYLEVVLDSAPDAIVTLDAESNITGWNKRAEKLFGYTPAEAMGKNIDDLLARGDPALHKEAIGLSDQLSIKQPVGPIETVRYHKDGTPLHVILSGSPVSVKDNFEGSVAIYSEITKRVQAESLLQQERDQAQQYLDIASVMLGALNAKGEITLINKKGCSVLQYEDEAELLGRNWFNVCLPKRVRDEVWDVFRELMAGKIELVEYYENPVVTKTGVERIIAFHNSVLRDSSSKITGILFSGEDITERKRAEDALRESEARYRTLFEHANDAIFLENDNDEIIDVNRQACELMGYTREELLQMTVPELQAPEMRGKKGVVLKQELEKYRGELFESLNLHRDGTRIPVEISTTSLPGRDTGLVLAIIRDITERKRIEDENRDNANRMEALLEIEKAITSTLDLEEVLDIIMKEMEKVIPYDSISLQTLQNNSLQILACRGFDQPSEVMELSFPLDPKYPNHHVIKTRKALAIEDVIQDYPHFQNQSTRYKSGHIRSWLGVPLISKGKVDGMIALDRSEATPFSKAEIQLATAIASQAALAIENASLFSEAQLRLERLSSLRRIDQTISSSMDLRMTLGILLGQVLHQLDVDAAAVLLYRSELQSLQFIAGQGFRTQALQFTDLRLGQGFAGRAALEQRTVKVNDLAATQTGFLRSPEFRTEGFVTYIGVPLVAKGNITGVLEIYHRQALEPDSEWMVFLETLAGQAAIAIDNIRLFEDLQSSNLQLRQAYDATIEGWAQALELRDMETKGHSHRAVELTQALARKMGIGDRKLTHIRWGVLLHDIGKMGVPDAVLQKPGPLTHEEWEIMREHPVHAYKWLSPISYLRPALDIPYCHHEKWDGTGYPQGLKEEHIPLSARIFSIVDVWDALLSDRPYRKAWTQKKALAYLREQSGQHFDPRVVEAFIELLLEEGHLT